MHALSTKTLFVLLAIALAVSMYADYARAEKYMGVVCGVDLDGVPWSTFCPAAQPVSYSRSAVTCSRVHPASTMFRHVVDLMGQGIAPQPPKCGKLASDYERLIAPGQVTDNPWLGCQRAWMGALKARCQFEFDDMPLDLWRSKYFAGQVKKP